jgi:hypothetical protein
VGPCGSIEEEEELGRRAERDHVQSKILLEQPWRDGSRQGPAAHLGGSPRLMPEPTLLGRAALSRRLTNCIGIFGADTMGGPSVLGPRSGQSIDVSGSFVVVS